MAASTLANTGVVNCAAFPTKVSTGTSNANIAGIAGYANTITINNCYCPTPGSAFFYNGAASGSSRGTIYGWLRGNNGATGSSGEIINAYWIDGFKAGASSGSFTYTKKEQSLTDAQMKNNGAVSMPSTGTAYPCFLDALNAGADEYNKAMFFDVRAEEWVMGTNGYPVIFGCPIASSTATSSKKRVSLLGDSITTYKGYTLFPSNGQYPNNNYSDFTSVTQTYWYQLIYDRMTNAVLEANSSHTATCIQNTVKNGYPGYGFLNRYADLGNPDVIFINGGTNDSWSFKLPVGTLDFSIATNDLDTYQFAQAYDKLIRLMKEKYPKAKIGVMGFSAGGHLACYAATASDYSSDIRPDFQILVYPVTTMSTGTHAGSRTNFLGADASNEEMMFYSNELWVSADTPQAFITYAKSETVVPPASNGKAFYNAMIKAGEKAELLELNGTKHGWHHGNADHETAYLQPMKAKLTPWLQKL